MAKDDWISIGEYSNAASARVAAGLLTALGLAHRVWPLRNPRFLRTSWPGKS